MDKDKIEQFSFKVTQANKTQLVVIVYDIILDDLKTAKENYSEDNLEEFVKTLKHAQRFVVELMRTLDCQYQIGVDLMALYMYMNRVLIKGIVLRKPEPLEGLDGIILKLRGAFNEISKTDYSGPVMRETEQVYAGLTYHKGNLSEAYLDAGNQIKRGFTV